jgi:putative salt-induced outer membrane protein
MRNKYFLYGLIVIFMPNLVVAAESDTAAKHGWDGEAELGIIATRGNTDTSSTNGKLRVEYLANQWTHQFRLETVRAKDNETVTANRLMAMFRSQYQFSERGYYFGTVRYEDDSFAGYDQRTTEIIGYGRNLYKGERFNLNMETGVGGRQTDNTDGTSEDETVVRLATNMGWKISETSSIKEELFVEWGDENTLTESVTDLKVRINSALAMKVSFIVKDNSKVIAGKKHTDTQTAVTLVYDF